MKPISIRHPLFLEIAAVLTFFSLNLGATAYAETRVPHTFSSGARSSAREVNENFETLADAINTLPAGPEGPAGLSGPQGPAGDVGPKFQP